MNAPEHERETVILYSQGEALATCHTHDRALIRRLERLRERGEAVIRVRYGEGFAEYRLPKTCLKVQFPRKPPGKEGS